MAAVGMRPAIGCQTLRAARSLPDRPDLLSRRTRASQTCSRARSLARSRGGVALAPQSAARVRGKRSRGEKSGGRALAQRLSRA